MLMTRDNSSQMRRRAANGVLSPPRAEPTFTPTSSSTALPSPSSLYSPTIHSITAVLSPSAQTTFSDEATIVGHALSPDNDDETAHGIRFVERPSPAPSSPGQLEDIDLTSPMTLPSEYGPSPCLGVEGYRIERNTSVASVDRPFVGRSISYHRPQQDFELITPQAPSIGPMSFVPSTGGRNELQVRLEMGRAHAGEGVDLGEVLLGRAESIGSSGSGSTGSATIRPALKKASSSDRSMRTMRKQVSMSALSAFSLSRNPSTGTTLTEFSSSSGRKSVRFADEQSSTPTDISPELRHTTKFPARWVGGVKAASIDCDASWEEWQDERSAGGARLWTGHKQILLASVATVFTVALTLLILSLLTYFRLTPPTYPLLITDPHIVLLTFLGSALLLVASLVGLTGVLLNSRQLLAVYNLLMWPCLLLGLVVAYTAFKKDHLALDLKLNELWSRSWGQAQRLVLQDTLHCCGYYSPLHQATLSNTCYPRTSLPGCKSRLLHFERDFLTHAYTAAFALSALHIVNLAIALVCSNHVNRTFGKGLMPRAYRLNVIDVQQNALRLARSVSAVRPKHLRRPSSLSSLSAKNSWSMQKLPMEGGLCGLGMAVGGEEEAQPIRSGRGSKQPGS